MFNRILKDPALAGLTLGLAAFVLSIGCDVPAQAINSTDYATDQQVHFARSVEVDLGKASDYCGEAGDFEQRNNSPLYDVERLTVASDDLKSALVTGTPWAATEARFYTTVGLDLINSYAAEGCDLAQFLISEKVVGYEYLWDTDYLVASSVHDTVHALPPPVIDPELLKPDPIVARLKEQVTMLDECAAKHGNPDHSAMAASLRAMLAITSDFPDKEEKQLLTFQVENANMVLAHC